MAAPSRGNRRDSKPRRKRRIYHRRKVYFITERGKIIPRRLSGCCAKHQRTLTHAIKQARTIAFLPFVGSVDLR
jgi:small subunit ribosomal protein S18